VALIPVLIGAGWRTLPRMRYATSWGQRLRFGGAPSRSLPLGIAAGLAVLPVASAWLGEPPAVTWCYVGLFLLIMVRRLTAGLGAELAQVRRDKSILLNRLLYDRSHL